MQASLNAIIYNMQDDQKTVDSPHFKRLVFQALFAIITGFFLFIFLWLGSIVVDQVVYAEKIMPGISMQGVDLSGLSIEEAALKLATEFTFSNTGEISLAYGDFLWQATPDQLGISLNLQASILQAYQFGRSGSLGRFLAYQLFNRRSNHNLPAILTFDQQKAYQYLVEASHLYNRPVREAGLELEGTQISAVPGQTGRSLDLAASIDLITETIKMGNFSRIDLPVALIQPEIMDASAFAAAAQAILAQPFTLRIPVSQPDSGREFRIKPDDIAHMLTFSRKQKDGQTILAPEFKQNVLKEYLNKLAGNINIYPENARFIFNDDTRELDLLSPAVSGRMLDVDASLAVLQMGLDKQNFSADLPLNVIQPEVDNAATAADLGINELVHADSSWFFGSTEARIQNIEKAASEFHGLLIPPGAVFSMAANMGDISLDNGYTEALIIFNGQTIEGIGGGVCQVSTTLFRTAFFAGFPINERHPHAYRVSYYEKTASNGRDADLAGLDATVYIPLVDLKFTNDTTNWLLMETYVNRASNRLTWKFYSTSDGRSVDWVTTGPVNIIKPKKPLYKQNPELNAGEINQVDWAADGADVRVVRSVIKNGSLYFSDTFSTHYEPWRAIYEYGPGTEGIPSSDEETQ